MSTDLILLVVFLIYFEFFKNFTQFVFHIYPPLLFYLLPDQTPPLYTLKKTNPQSLTFAIVTGVVPNMVDYQGSFT